MRLIYCAARSKQYAEIAIPLGFHYGAQLQDERTFVYYPPSFCDQNWKRPDKDGYMRGLALHRPWMASVMDWERPEQLADVLTWAEEASQYATDYVMIIPKNGNDTRLLPRYINGKAVVLGYSVPSKHGGAGMAFWEVADAFRGWPVHLLGGSPHMQMRLFHSFDVVSVDGDQHQLLSQRGKFWWRNGWHSLRKVGGDDRTKDVPYEAFRRSCTAIMQAWQAMTDVELFTPEQEKAA